MCLINKYDLTIFSISQVTSLYLLSTFCNWGWESFQKKAHFAHFYFWFIEATTQTDENVK